MASSFDLVKLDNPSWSKMLEETLSKISTDLGVSKSGKVIEARLWDLELCEEGESSEK